MDIPVNRFYCFLNVSLESIVSENFLNIDKILNKYKNKCGFRIIIIIYIFFTANKHISLRSRGCLFYFFVFMALLFTIYVFFKYLIEFTSSSDVTGARSFFFTAPPAIRQ